MGHFGTDKTYALLRDSYYWPRSDATLTNFMSRDATSVNVIRRPRIILAAPCIRYQSPTQKALA